MRNSTLVYRQKLLGNIAESRKHLMRLESALLLIQNRFGFPLGKESFVKLIENVEYLAYSDQVIYRFSKLQDCMGAKLFKSLLMYEGENTDKPFLDILNRLEAMNIVCVDKWFELRDIRNEIAHDYDDGDGVAINILNAIFDQISELKNILLSIESITFAR